MVQVIWGSIVVSILIDCFLWALATKNANRNTDSLYLNALKDLNTSEDGLVYIGTESEVVLKNSISWSTPSKTQGYVGYMCKTNKGNWFNLAIPFKLGIIGERRVFPLTEQEAKDILYKYPNIYRQHFGEPEKA